GSGTSNRAEFTKMIVEMIYSKDLIESVRQSIQSEQTYVFPDVEPNAWFSAFIGFGKIKQILNGYAHGVFIPWKEIERAEAMKILVNAAVITNSKIAGDMAVIESGLDANAPWFLKYALLIDQYNGFNLPTGVDPGAVLGQKLNRQEAANMIYAVIQNSGNEYGSTLSNFKEKLSLN
ncbi:MAG: hypothetical protein U1C97_01390, partial [Candidatus Gracilibacteria bacterium]|nr:hypothetical protein [Candidatus Gracilibacteria bacterium]